MLSAECPNCGSPIAFKHSASVLAVCSACRSSIQRTDESLEKVGEISALSQDLSPFQVGVKGRTAKGVFTVIGVLRKGREGLRWNEWRILFDNGDLGWLSEGNGQLILFDSPPQAVTNEKELRVGDIFSFRKSDQTRVETPFMVTEVASAKLLAAEGELNVLVRQGEALSYIDAREVGGIGYATVDHEPDGHIAWVGHVVEMAALELRGLRPFLGWSDSALLEFEGPQIKSTRSFDCPQCGGPFDLKAPGQALALGCQYCGAELVVDESEAGIALRFHKKAKQAVEAFSIPLGSVIYLKGQRWELLGAIRRSVIEDGEEYPWEEYLWRNPYVGYRWMIFSEGHFSWGRACTELPVRDGKSLGYTDLTWRSKIFKAYARGTATVKEVVGEFTWQIAKGDRAMTYDFISPPFMLSLESIRDSTAAGGSEDNWTVVEYLDASEMETAFGESVPDSLRGARSGLLLTPPSGVAPHQPNPWSKPSVMMKGILTLGFLFVVWVACYFLLFMGQGGQPVKSVVFEYDAYQKDKSSYSKLYGAEKGGEPIFEIQKSDPWTAIKLEHGVLPLADAPISHVALLNLDTGRAYLFPSGIGQEGTYASPQPGRYALRVEHAFNKIMVNRHNVQLKDSLKTGVKKKPAFKTTVKITKNPTNPTAFSMWLVFACFLLVGPMGFLFFRATFESRRWRNSSV